MLGKQALGLPSPLLITHRLDACTEGVVVLGKTREFVQRFNRLLQQEGAARKLYRALTAVPLQSGELLCCALIVMHLLCAV